MLRTIHLHGKLKKKFGAKHKFDVRTAVEAVRAFNVAFPGEFIAEMKEGAYRLVRGDRHNGLQLDLDLANSFNLGNADLHIIPVPQGAGNGKGIGKTILGVALIGAAVFFSGGTLAAPLSGMSSQAFALGGMSVSWGNIALVGLGLTLSGAASLLAKTNSTDDKDDSSFTINGPSNNAQQGAAIPLIYGEVIVGSTCISFDSDIEDIGAYQGVTDSMGATVQAILNQTFPGIYPAGGG